MPQHFRKTHKIRFLDLCVGLFLSVISSNAADYMGEIDAKNTLVTIYKNEPQDTIMQTVEIGNVVFVDNSQEMRLIGTIDKSSFNAKLCEYMSYREYKCLDDAVVEGNMTQESVIGAYVTATTRTPFRLKPAPFEDGKLTCEEIHQYPKIVFNAQLDLGSGHGSPIEVDYECNGTIKNLPFMKKILWMNEDIRGDWKLGAFGGSIRYAQARYKAFNFLSAGIAPDVFEREQKRYEYYSNNRTREEHIQAIQRYFKLWAHQSLGNFEAYTQFWDEYVRALNQLTKHYQTTFHLSKEQSEAYAKRVMQYIFLNTAGSVNVQNEDISSLDKQIIASKGLSDELLSVLKNAPQEQLDQGLKTAILHQKSIDYLQALLDTGARIDIGNESALFFALRQPNSVLFLLSKQPNVNYENNFGKTALFYAIAYNDHKLVELLLNHKADVNHHYFSKEKLDQIDYGIGEGFVRINRSLRTPLMHAAQHSDVKMMSLLIDRGADINAQDENNATIADYAKGSNKKENLEFAHSLGVNENPNVYYLENLYM